MEKGKGKGPGIIIKRGMVLALVVGLMAPLGACRNAERAEDTLSKPAVDATHGWNPGIAVGEPNPSAPGSEPGELIEKEEDPASPEVPGKVGEKPAPLDEPKGEEVKEMPLPSGIQAVLPDGFTVKPGVGLVYVYHGGQLLGEVHEGTILTDTGMTREELVVLVAVASLLGMPEYAAMKAVDGWLDTGIPTVVDNVEVSSGGKVLKVVMNR